MEIKDLIPNRVHLKHQRNTSGGRLQLVKLLGPNIK